MGEERELAAILDSLIEGFQVLDREWRYAFVNAAAASHGRSSAAALVGRTILECYPGIEKTELFAEMRACMETRVPHRMENAFEFSDGSVRHFELRIEPAPKGISVLSIDITDRIHAEKRAQVLSEQKNQADRMETVGRLAAGVAHDFNNLLGIILAKGETALAREGGPTADDVTGMLDAAQRSADLTKQLLAFTTKEDGEGTGLGLASVDGLVHQTAIPSPPDEVRTVLIAEDSALLRKLVAATLTSAGFKVLTARSGSEALELCKQPGKIDLLITDVVMPGMQGPELILASRRLRPDLLFLCTSGYSTEELRDGNTLPEGVLFLEKPYLPSVFLKTVRTLLGQAAGE